MTVLDNFGERQDADRKDWGYYANLSIYEFAASWARGKRCLEIGCGTAYGANHLMQSGAASVLAIDKDESNISQLEQRFPAIRFIARDLDIEGLDVPAQSVDVVFSSNVFEHLAYPDPVLADANRALSKDGVAILAVPPIVLVGMLAMNAKNIFHINNIPTWAWVRKLQRYFHNVQSYRHWVRAEKLSSSDSIIRDNAELDDFVFTQVAEHEAKTITAIFVCVGPRKSPIATPVENEGCPPEWRAAKVEADARQEMVTDLKRELSSMRKWIEENRDAGTGAAFILDGVCRQLQFLSG